MGCSSHQENPNPNPPRSDLWSSKKKKNQKVFLEGYVESITEDEDQGESGSGSKGVSRTVSLTDEDLDELKGCVDLGFGFNYEEIPELCNTLPALELCYSITQKFLDQKSASVEDSSEDGNGNGNGGSEVVNENSSSSSSGSSNQIANWKISSPGDNPDDVKARLKFWAQAVACTVKLCN